MLDWSQCSEVERSPEKVSGAWVFRATRVPVRSLFENLEAGATIEDFLKWFPGVKRKQVEAVLECARESFSRERAETLAATRQGMREFDRGQGIPLEEAEKRLPEKHGFSR